MFENTLFQLESLVSSLLQQNQNLSEQCQNLQQEVSNLRQENENLQMAAMEQEEQQNATLARLQGILQRAGQPLA